MADEDFPEIPTWLNRIPNDVRMGGGCCTPPPASAGDADDEAREERPFLRQLAP